MRTRAAALLLALVACDSIMTPDHEIRAGLTKEEMEAGPSYYQMMGAILNDVRIWREVDQKLDDGKAVCTGILREGDATLCSQCKEELEYYLFPDKTKDQLYRVEESAYYCRKESFYYYHYVGGKKGLNVWLGPYTLKRERPKTEE